MMGDTISSDASAMDVDSQEATEEASAAQPAADDQPARRCSASRSVGDYRSTGLSGSSSSAPGTLLGS